MKIFIQLLVFTVVFTAYGTKKGPIKAISDNSGLVVKQDSTYKVVVEKDITYAKGLSHQMINGNVAKEIPLKLDAYIPDNTQNKRPAIVLIHGGGFTGGTKDHKYIVDMAKYFAARGWVAFSIDYRLKKHKGTVPNSWMDYANENLVKEMGSRFLSMYPANRDAKAAIRWLYANAGKYHVDTNYITVGGGSAGAIIATALGVSKPEDYTNEIPTNIDPTLNSTHLHYDSKIHTVLDFWGSKIAVDAIEFTKHTHCFDETNAPILIVHGTEDPKVKFSKAMALKEAYSRTKVPCAFYPIPNKGHGVWRALVQGKSLSKLSFEFIVEQQGLIVQ